MLNRSFFAVLVALAMGLTVTACDDSKSSEESAGHDHAHQGQEHHDHNHEGEGHHNHEGEGDHAHGGEEQSDDKKENASVVEVPKDGKEFDPAVSVDKLPEGAWHCDMGGKSHYAAMQEGDGRCPVCNMMLKQAE